MLLTSEFFEELSYLYMRCSATGNIVHCNKFTCSLSGFKKSQIINSNFIDYFHPDDTEEVLSILLVDDESSDSTCSKEYTHRFRKTDGSYFWCKWQCIRSQQDNSICLMGEDVSEQKRIKSAILAIEEVTDTGYWEIDLDTGILYWSDKIHQIHETDKHTFKPRIEDGLKFYAPESIPILTDALKELEETGKPYELELSFVTNKGRNLTVIAHGFSETKNGRVVRNFGTFKDLTQQKEEEASLRTLERRIILSLEAAKIGVWDYDFEQDNLVWDKRLLEIFDKQPEQFNSSFEDWRSAVHPDDIEVAEKAFFDSIESRDFFNHTFRIVTSSGEVKHVLGMASAVYDEQGNPVKATGVNLDLSESERTKQALEKAKNQAQENANLAKKMADKAKSADTQKSVFLANMSHEIRTPISGILGLLDMLAENIENAGNKNDKQLKYIHMAKNTSQHLLKIISDILDFSKIEAGKIQIHNSPIALQKTLLDMIDSYTLQAKEKSLFLDYASDGLDDSIVIGDEVRLKQILYNLLSNALKFTQKGGITIRAKLRLEKDDIATFICSVVDTGKGIQTDKLDILFSPFEQVDAGSSKSSEGTGLGLAISNDLAMLMGGKISAYSEEGVGSTFTLHLPFKVAKEHKNPLTISQQVQGQSTDDVFKNKHVLVVEDNEINQVIVTNMLEQLGLEFSVAEDGLEAIETMTNSESNKFDMILMDCQMPRMDGYETTQVIRTSPALDRFKNIPIIALTANAMVGDREKCIKAGMNDYIAKPLAKNILVAKLQAIFS
ncbi:PAS domain-containing sensor histidine kinase [Glaciecola petra]|uniref:histidine kinase n=1 Tax=Glaciecola petra TaxID=3075602 RepID=A0ABU2ZQ09_9ALTE|nr:PAS domain-containing protein [Aestuariibacter sp. P117]MDT0594706.1 PAS domain-containing protein [Aestuariibacter sp. P117]